ncbi:hypothetical protein L1887_31118 [Cichorium endivia]|nr:hypothetical protein L1887_31118 [Cichorium endivia]
MSEYCYEVLLFIELFAEFSGKPCEINNEEALDLFDEETEEEKKASEERAAAAKAAGKKKESGKSSVLMDFKPWDDDTDMKKFEEAVRSVHLGGLLLGAFMHGIKKLQIMISISSHSKENEDTFVAYFNSLQVLISLAIKVLNMIKLYGKPIRVNKMKKVYDTLSAFGVIVRNPKITRDPQTGNSRGFRFISYDSFEVSDASIEASSNPTTQKSRPHILFASGPPTLPQPAGAPVPFTNGAVPPVTTIPAIRPPPPPVQLYQPMQMSVTLFQIK